MKIPTHTLYKTLVISLLTTCFNWGSLAQKPKKLLANGYYEQAFLEASKKQNKKVKLKQKHTSIIDQSFDIIYAKGIDIITSSNYNWKQSYDQFLRVANFRSKVKHPGVVDKLKNNFYDDLLLDHLATKFNQENNLDLNKANEYTLEEKFFKAMEILLEIKVRHEQASKISTFKNRLDLIDIEEKITQTHIQIGNQFIEQARKRLVDGSQKDAKEAIESINNARKHRPLDQEEEELLKLANLIIKESWMQEAKILLNTNTKRNGRLAYELIKKARSIKSLTTEEEILSRQALAMGMTNIRVVVSNKNGVHDSKNLSGILNKENISEWITYYDMESDLKMDFELEIIESKPKIVLGDIRKRIEQRTKAVEYFENETNASGQVIKVKKTKNVQAFVAIFSRTKTATLVWKISLIDPVDGKIIYTENNTSKIERVNQFASLESGDILAMPDNIETEISLDSQPFPTDIEMNDLVTRLYLKELTFFLKSKKDHLLNLDLIQK
jgi:hypothetical protein